MKKLVLVLTLALPLLAQNPIQRDLYCEDAGASDTYACSFTVAPAAYATGVTYKFKANTANTGAATVNFNSLGAKTIKKQAGGVTTDLDDNDIRGNQWVELIYDGTNMQMQSMLGNAAAAAGGYPAILTSTWVSGGKTVSASTTVQQAPIGRLDLSYDTSSARYYLQTAGTLRNLCVYTFDAQPGTGSMTITTYKNGSTSSQVATVTSSGAAGRYCDTSNTLSMSSGDYFYYTITNNASGTSAQILWSSVEVVP